MTRLRSSMPLLVLALSGGLLGCGAKQPRAVSPRGPSENHPERTLDHFLCYQATDLSPASATVMVRDQFDKEGTWRNAKVGNVLAFCNPVAKKRQDRENKILSPDHHLVGYSVTTEGAGKTVAINNQITDYKDTDVDVGQAPWLLAPAQKLSPIGHPEPQGLDHFLCYQPAHPEYVHVDLRVNDELTKEYKDATLGPLNAVCNPIDKRHDQKEFRRQHPDAHLACYELKLAFQPPAVKYKDQFHPRGGALQLVRPYALCVPSTKEIKPEP